MPRAVLIPRSLSFADPILMMTYQWVGLGWAGPQYFNENPPYGAHVSTCKPDNRYSSWGISFHRLSTTMMSTKRFRMPTARSQDKATTTRYPFSARFMRVRGEETRFFLTPLFLKRFVSLDTFRQKASEKKREKKANQKSGRTRTLKILLLHELVASLKRADHTTWFSKRPP